MSLLLSLSSSLCLLFWCFAWIAYGFPGIAPTFQRLLSPSYYHLHWRSEVYNYDLESSAHSGLEVIPDFAYSGDPQAILRSDVILISHWWIAILIGLHGKVFLCNLQGIAWLTLNTILQVAYVWFGKFPRKPPDKSVSQVLLDSFYEHFPRSSSIIWHILHPFGNKVLDLGRKNSVPIYMQTRNAIPKHFLGIQRKVRFRRCRTAYSNVLLSLSTVDMASEANFQLGSKSYCFVLDTGTSDHVCRDQELFINEPEPCPHISLRGVGGNIQASGLGSIKFRVHDDDGNKHDLIIHNVLYVPECPINLISPQLLSSSCKSSRLKDAGLLTYQDMTIFFWENMTFTKTIHHQAGVGIPILQVNQEFSGDALFSTAESQCHLCNTHPSYLQTSAPHVIDDDSEPHVIPNDEGANIDLPNITLASDNTSVHVIPLDDEVDDYPTTLSGNQVFDIDEDPTDDFAPSIPVATAEHPSSTQQLEADIDASLSPVSNHDETVSNLLDQLQQQQSEPMSKDQREYLRLHGALNHLPHSKMKRLAEKGIIPKKFSKIKPPLCSACILVNNIKNPGGVKVPVEQFGETLIILPVLVQVRTSLYLPYPASFLKSKGAS